jgi:capsule polysaccharide modification protein KpsS
VDSYLNYNHAKNELKTKIKRYLEFIYSQKDYYPDQTELFKDLSVKLRNELTTLINQQILKKWHISKLNTFSQVFLKELIQEFQEKKYSPNEVIIQEFERSKNN